MRRTLDRLDGGGRRGTRGPLMVVVAFVLVYFATSRQSPTAANSPIVSRDPEVEQDGPLDEPKPVSDNMRTDKMESLQRIVDRQKVCTPAILANADAHLRRANTLVGCHYKNSFAIDTLHAVVPEATVFADIGVNKGYHTVTMMALYRPHWGLTNRGWFAMDNSIGCGSCWDCRLTETPIVHMRNRVCGGPAVPEDGICFSPDKPLPEVRLLTFDGSPVFPKMIYGQLDKHASSGYRHPESYPKAWAMDLSKLKDNIWTVQNFAFVDKYDAKKTVKFLQYDERGQVVDSNLAQGVPPADAPANSVYVEVPVMTIDEMRKRENIKHFDLIKTDTEGFDAFVARGAINTLKEHAVTMYTMEISELWRTEKIIDTVRMFEENDYTCYGEYMHSLVKYTHGCWSDIYQQAIAWGNMVCVLSTTEKGQKIIESFDAHSVQFMP